MPEQNNGLRSGNLLHRLLIDTSPNSEFFNLKRNSGVALWLIGICFGLDLVML